MTSSQFYRTDPADPDAPVVLAEYTGPHHGTIRPGDLVVYENPSWRAADGTYKTGGMDGTYTVAEIIDFNPARVPDRLMVEAILNGDTVGEYQCSADNLRAVGKADGGQEQAP